MTKLKKIFISSFILLTFLTMVRVHLPLEYRIFQAIYKPIEVYLQFFSIYQDWVMFSPNPATMDVYMTAKVEFDDGSTDTYEFPRTTEMGVIETYLYGEKYRKIIEESIRRDDHSFLWDDTAKFVLRKIKDQNFHKIPLRVNLIRHWSETPEMNEKFIPHLSRMKEYQSHQFYTYEVI